MKKPFALKNGNFGVVVLASVVRQSRVAGVRGGRGALPLVSVAIPHDFSRICCAI